MDYHPVENTCYAVSFFRASSKWCPLSILLLGTYFSCINLFSFVFVPLTPIWMKFCLRNMMSSSEFDESGVLCSIWTKCDKCIFFCWILLWVLLQPPTTRLAAPLYQNKHFMSKIHTQSHFVHMLHNTPDSSNFEVIIMFPGRLDIYSLVIEVYLYYEVKSLRSLT